MQNLIETIRRYVTLSEDDVSIIGQLFVKKELEVDECFLTPGHVCKDFAFVDSGLLRHCIDNDGKEETFYFSAEGDFVCDYESFVNKLVSQKRIVALEKTTLYSISYQNMQRFYEKVSAGERFGRLFVEKTFSKAIRHIISIHTDPAEQRYLNFLTAYKHIQQRIPQYYIASFVGVTPQSLSRIRRNFLKK
jgi:CRP-like cAMP-binding protein